ncbi:MAG TPA: hypothetical protein PJ982_05455, partial [Lacipirellulaceae bacterium]|nr:hypothetical protein [Lacipirellulaceae bacterium]
MKNRYRLIKRGSRGRAFCCEDTETGRRTSLGGAARLPCRGPLFPCLRTVRSGDRAKEFKRRCQGLGITGATLHSYRYAWAERAKAAGYPERFAQ